MIIYFDDSHCEQMGDVGIIFVTPQGVPIHYLFKLAFSCTNNNDEYEALVLALKTTQ